MTIDPMTEAVAIAIYEATYGEGTWSGVTRTAVSYEIWRATARAAIATIDRVRGKLPEIDCDEVSALCRELYSKSADVVNVPPNMRDLLVRSRAMIERQARAARTIAEATPADDEIERCCRACAGWTPEHDDDEEGWCCNSLSQNHRAKTAATSSCERWKIHSSLMKPAEVAACATAKVSGGIGWLFYNPDTGMEFSESHPVESGECPDAESVREATAEILLDELKEAWSDAHVARTFSAALSDYVVKLEASDKTLREALEFYANPENYTPNPLGPAFDRRDLSATARAALAQHKEAGR